MGRTNITLEGLLRKLNAMAITAKESVLANEHLSERHATNITEAAAKHCIISVK
jgi:hypothetical protein